ncbi:hypothetical protein CPLU01_09035 [Colletotrichum plurivorum]|uniref:Uncharacterized protein n=1 Tax=Colletotrichum plurivorum TaxID=2175906 RepID=A0A8H6NCH7_9PEZI|nr:hypothetical protein CPLU01_09035 [Colletotrichum plurivorum]
MPALLMTAAILVIGSLHFYWYPEQGPLIKHKYADYRVDPDIISNVLQLVAKLHELFIVASLSSIALAMFRRSLVTRGVHLGFLTGGYRVGDLAYLKTAAFWRQGLDISNLWGMMLPGFLVFATLMSTVVGPASAILLLPTLGWYDVDASIAFSNIELPLLYARNRTSIWVPVRDEASNKCYGPRGLYLGFCPAGGFEELFNWLYDYRATDLSNNLTFHSTSADLRRHLVFTLTNNTDSEVTTLCTTPPHFITNSIGLFQRYIDSADVGGLSGEPRYRIRTAKEESGESLPQDDSTLYQPFVQAKCDLFYKEDMLKDPSSVFYFPVDHLNCFGEADCLRAQDRGMALNKTLMAPHLLNVTVASDFYVDFDNSPIAFIHGQVPDTSSGEPRHFYYLCSLLASLIPSTFTVDPKASDTLQSSSSSADSMQKLHRKKNSEGVRVVKFMQTWFRALNPHWQDANRRNFTAIGELIENFASKEGNNGTQQVAFVDSDGNNTDYKSAEVFLAKVFGAYLTDGLARMSQEDAPTLLVLDRDGDRSLRFIDLNDQYGHSGGVHELTAINATAYRHIGRGETTEHNGTIAGFLERIERYMPIDIVAERYGYGSGQQRATLHWAQAVMGAYLAIVVVYASWVVVMNALDAFGLESNQGQARVLSIIPWSDLQDLIILALRTPPPDDEDLADAGAGVSSSKVWEKVVSAGADGDKAQLVLGEGQLANRLQVDRSAEYL